MVLACTTWCSARCPLRVARTGYSSSRGKRRAATDWWVESAPDIFFLLFLPLLFLDGWRIPKQGLSRDKGTILEPALGLVVFTVAGVGYFVSWAALVLVEQSRCSAAATTINRYSDCKTFLRIRMNFFEEVGSFYRYRFSRTGISAIALRRRS
jgi:hypothetical protein